MILREFPEEIAQSCSCTTRFPRVGEVKNKDYDFVSVEEFGKKIAANEFLEYAQVFGDYYGTCNEEVARIRAQGKHVILVIDTRGAMQVKQKVPGIFIFLSPPSFEELRHRLFKRRTEEEEKIQERLVWAKQEMEMVSHYDYHIVNDDLGTAYQILRSIIIAEEHKRR